MKSYMLLLHGTSTDSFERVVSSPSADIDLYLTDDYDQANYYAEVACDEIADMGGDGEEEFMAVALPTRLLLADRNAFDEPLTFMYGRPGVSVCNESEWHRAIDRGDIPYPDEADWKSSMIYSGSVKVEGSDVCMASFCKFDGRNLPIGVPISKNELDECVESGHLQEICDDSKRGVFRGK